MNVVKEYAEVCQRHRRLPEDVKVMEMAERMLEVDVRLLRFFNAAATVGLGKVLFERLGQIELVKRKPSRRREVNPSSPQPYKNTLPERYKDYTLNQLAREMLWIMEFYKQWDHPMHIEGCTVNDGLELFFPDDLPSDEGDVK